MTNGDNSLEQSPMLDLRAYENREGILVTPAIYTINDYPVLLPWPYSVMKDAYEQGNPRLRGYTESGTTFDRFPSSELPKIGIHFQRNKFIYPENTPILTSDFQENGWSSDDFINVIEFGVFLETCLFFQLEHPDTKRIGGSTYSGDWSKRFVSPLQEIFHEKFSYHPGFSLNILEVGGGAGETLLRVRNQFMPPNTREDLWHYDMIDKFVQGRFMFPNIHDYKFVTVPEKTWRVISGDAKNLDFIDTSLKKGGFPGLDVPQAIIALQCFGFDMDPIEMFNSIWKKLPMGGICIMAEHELDCFNVETMLPTEQQLEIYDLMIKTLRQVGSIEQLHQSDLAFLLKDVLPKMQGVYEKILPSDKIFRAHKIPVDIVVNENNPVYNLAVLTKTTEESPFANSFVTGFHAGLHHGDPGQWRLSLRRALPKREINAILA